MLFLTNLITWKYPKITSYDYQKDLEIKSRRYTVSNYIFSNAQFTSLSSSAKQSPSRTKFSG